MIFEHRHFGRHGRGEGHLGHHGRHGRFGRGERRVRLFEQGDLRLVILSLLAERPRHGYDLIKALEEMTGGAYSPSPGLIYPTLTLLQEQGLAEPVDSDDGKKAYAATDAGRAALEADKAAVDAILARLTQAAERSSSAMPRLVRAMENLRTALRLKLGPGGLTEDQLAAIVKLLDDAAGAVEAV